MKIIRSPALMLCRFVPDALRQPCAKPTLTHCIIMQTNGIRMIRGISDTNAHLRRSLICCR